MTRLTAKVRGLSAKPMLVILSATTSYKFNVKIRHATLNLSIQSCQSSLDEKFKVFDD